MPSPFTLLQFLQQAGANQMPMWPQQAPQQNQWPRPPVSPQAVPLPSPNRGIPSPFMQPGSVPMDFGFIDMPKAETFTPPDLANKFPIGPLAKLEAPGTMPNMDKRRAEAEALFKAPNFGAPIPPPTPRPDLKFADPTQYRDALRAQGPQDTREPEEDFRKGRFRDALSAAALASAQAQDPGQALALAGGAFLGQARESDKMRRAEELDFNEATRQFNVQMAGLDWQIAQAEAEQANAVSELDFLRAEDARGFLIEQKAELERQGDKLREIGFQRLQTMLDFDRSEYAVGEAGREFRNQEALRREQKWEISPDGSTMTTVTYGPDGKGTVEQLPFGIMGKAKKLSEIAAVLPGAAGFMVQKQLQYEMGKQFMPGFAKNQLILDLLLHPKGTQLFDPEDTGGKDAFGAFLYGGDILRDKLTTSSFERVYNDTKESIQKSVDSGLIPAELQADALQEALARNLAPFLTSQVIERAKKLNDPIINLGLQQAGFIK